MLGVEQSSSSSRLYEQRSLRCWGGSRAARRARAQLALDALAAVHQPCRSRIVLSLAARDLQRGWYPLRGAAAGLPVGAQPPAPVRLASAGALRCQSAVCIEVACTLRWLPAGASAVPAVQELGWSCRRRSRRRGCVV